MKRNLLLMLVSVITAFGVGVAHSKECKGVNFPEQAQVEGSTLTLNGLGLRQATVLKINVYVAALYVVKPSTDADAILAANTPKELISTSCAVAARTLTKQEEGFANARTGPRVKAHRDAQGLDGGYEKRPAADLHPRTGRGHSGRCERSGEGHDQRR
jgi:hypothetical protein